MRELLRGHDTEGEPGIDDLGGEVLRGGDTPREERAEADLAGERHAVVEGREGASLEEVGGPDRVAGGAEAIGEGQDSGGEAQHVVEEHDFGHRGPPSGRDLVMANDAIRWH